MTNHTNMKENDKVATPFQEWQYQADLKKYYYSIAVEYRICLLRIEERLDGFNAPPIIRTLIAEAFSTAEAREKPVCPPRNGDTDNDG